MRPIASVHIDIARFGFEVNEIRDDAELGLWLRRLIKCLSLRDPSIHEYGSELLEEVEEYRNRDSRRKKAFIPKDSKGKTRKDTERHGTHAESAPRAEQLEQSRADRKTETSFTELAPRPRNELFDAIQASFFPGQKLSKSDGARIGKLAQTLREREATPEQVNQKKSLYRKLHPDWECTAEAVIKHWPELNGVEKKPYNPMNP